MFTLRRHAYLGILMAALAAALAGCGGGGGGGGGGSAPPSGTFTLSATSVTFTAKVGVALPAPQVVTAHITGTGAAKIGAAYANGATPAPWLTVTVAGSGSDYSFTLSANTTALNSGSYTATLTVGTADANNTILQTQQLTVTYSVHGGLVMNTPAQSATAVGGDSNATQMLTFAVNSPSTIQWTSSSNASWLTGPPATQTGGGNFALTVDSTGLKSGTYNGVLTITNAADVTDTATLAVTLTVTLPTLTVSANQLLLGGTTGLDLSTQPLSFSLNTNQGSYPWSIVASTTTGGSWLVVSGAAAGSVSATSAMVSLDASRGALLAGTYLGQVVVQVTVNGEVVSQTVAVSLNVDPNRLVVTAQGVAFSSFPSRQVLSRTLGVSNSWGLSGVRWAATSDTPSWLTVTPGGTTGTPLVLTATPGTLTAGQYTAFVTLTSPDTGVGNTETVRVGLTVGTSDPAPSIDVAGVVMPGFVASPVEPVIFGASGAVGAPIDVYDVNTGVRLRSFAAGGSSFTQAFGLTVSGDGQTLYVLDVAAGGNVIRVLDAMTGAVLNSYSGVGTLANLATVPPLQVVRPNAHPLLLSGSTGDAYDLATGAHTMISIGGAPVVMVPSPDQRKLYTEDTALSPGTVYEFSMVYSTLPGAGLSLTQTASNLGNGLTGSNGVVDSLAAGRDIAVAADGSKVYVAGAGNYGFGVLDGTSLLLSVLPGQAYPNSIDASWNGLIACGEQSGGPVGDILVYDASGTQQGAALLSGPSIPGSLFARSLRFSGDGTRLISDAGNNTGGPLRFQTAPQ